MLQKCLQMRCDKYKKRNGAEQAVLLPLLDRLPEGPPGRLQRNHHGDQS
jgi:hypothetical protein